MVLVSNNDVSQINASLQSNYDSSSAKLKNVLYNADAISLGVKRIQNKIQDVSNKIDSSITAYTNEYIDEKLSHLNMDLRESGKYLTTISQTNGLIAASNNSIPAYDNTNNYTKRDYLSALGDASTVLKATYDINIPENSYFFILVNIYDIQYHFNSQKLYLTAYNNIYNLAFKPQIIQMSQWEKYIPYQHGRFYLESMAVRHYYDLYAFGVPNQQQYDVEWEGTEQFPGLQMTGYTKEHPITNLSLSFEAPHKYVYDNASTPRYVNDNEINFEIFVKYESKLEV